MTHFLLRRLAGFIATLWVASVLVFVALELLPGSAAQVRLGETASPEAVAAL
jgi:peptide/nickel transport system permease protein